MRPEQKAGKMLLLCNVLPQQVELLTTADSEAVVPASAILPDLDSALEWMEEETLRKRERTEQESLPLEQHEFFRGLTPDELEAISKLVRRQTFDPGAVICNEGDEVA